MVAIPYSSRSWMQHNREAFFDRPLSKLCLPASHDAATYMIDFGTQYAVRDVVITQTKSVLQQLELGVRRLDIRPTLANPLGQNQYVWGSGHYTRSDIVGWQGANCDRLEKIVHDVNEFTRENAELVILELSHIMQLHIDTHHNSQQVGLLDRDWDDLFKELRKLDNLWVAGNKNKGKQLQDYTLREFIGNGRAAVVVIIWDAPYPEHLYDMGFWPVNYNKTNKTLSGRGTSITRMQTDTEAGTSAAFQLLGLEKLTEMFGLSVLGLAEKTQRERLPKVLQEIANKKKHPCFIGMDKIENSDLLTICLAVSYWRYYLDKDMGRDDKIIVYGGVLIKQDRVHAEMQDAINKGKKYYVGEESFKEDPFRGMPKSCAVFWAGGIRGGWERESYKLNF